MQTPTSTASADGRLLLSAVSCTCAIQKRNGAGVIMIIHTALHAQKILAALPRPQGPIGIP
jgi:hypothetical protein